MTKKNISDCLCIFSLLGVLTLLEFVVIMRYKNKWREKHELTFCSLERVIIASSIAIHCGRGDKIGQTMKNLTKIVTISRFYLHRSMRENAFYWPDWFGFGHCAVLVLCGTCTFCAYTERPFLSFPLCAVTMTTIRFKYRFIGVG